MCPFGWSGRLCEQPLEVHQLDSCHNRPCGEHGTCRQLKNSSDFYCECDEGMCVYNFLTFGRIFLVRYILKFLILIFLPLNNEIISKSKK